MRYFHDLVTYKLVYLTTLKRHTSTYVRIWKIIVFSTKGKLHDSSDILVRILLQYFKETLIEVKLVRFFKIEECFY